MAMTEFWRSLTTEQQRNTMRCAEIDQTQNALEAERRALQTRIEALNAVGNLFETSEHVVEQARTRQARLNPAGLYKSSQQVVAEVVRQRVVEVLAAAVEAREGLLVQQGHQAVALGDGRQDVHREHVLVRRDRDALVHGRELELRRRDLVVPRLDRDPEQPQLALEVHHEVQHALAS